LVLAELFSGILQTTAAESGEPLEERINEIDFDSRAGTCPDSCLTAFRALAVDCLKPHSKRIATMAAVMLRLRAMEDEYCPR
jgi:hypothetical protein